MRFTLRQLAGLLVLAVLAFAFGMARTRQPPPAQHDAWLSAYPHGSWRLAPSALDDVVLRLSHIVVGHLSAAPRASALTRDAFWKTSSTAAAQQRSRQEAVQMAQRLARELRAHPQRFASLARTYSDERATAEQGGLLGPVHARDLPPEFLDALATMAVGEVSEPIETRSGFHVLRLETSLPAEWVSGRELVIAYQGTDEWRRDTYAVPTRSRAQAHALARELARKAQAQPSQFAQLIQQHSERRTREIGGDCGVFSTTEPGAESTLVEALRSLAVGQVSEPIDSPYGFRVVMRVAIPLTRSERYATQRIELSYGDAATGAKMSKTQAQALMATIAADVRREPARFSAYQQRYCCTEDLTWERGHGYSMLTRALEATAVGALVSETIDTPEPGTLGLYRRMDAKPLPRAHRSVRSHVPSPKAPDFNYFVAKGHPRILAHVIAEIRARTVAPLALPAPQARALDARLRALSRQMEEGDETTRLQAFAETQAQAREWLGPQAFTRWWRSVEALVSSALMAS